MGTHTALYVQTEDEDHFGAKLREFLTTQARTESISLESSPILPIYGDLFRRSAPPNAFSYAQCPAGWCTAHFNCFSQLTEFANALSVDLNARVIVLNVQTNSCCYYLGLHEDGRRRRAFSYEDGKWKLQDGVPLPFEIAAPLAKDIRESDVERFCESLTLPLCSRDNFPDTWHTLRAEP